MDAISFTVIFFIVTQVYLVVKEINRQEPIGMFEIQWLIKQGAERAAEIIKEADSRSLKGKALAIYIADRIKKDRNNEETRQR